MLRGAAVAASEARMVHVRPGRLPTSRGGTCHFFIREQVEEGRLVVPFVRTSDNLADFFTKPLAPDLFEFFRAAIMNLPREAGTAALSSGSSRLASFEHGWGSFVCVGYAPAPPGCHWADS